VCVTPTPSTVPNKPVNGAKLPTVPRSHP
jgi:hypothetical protein